MREGDEILDTQGSVDLMTLIGGFINQSGKSDDKAGDSAPAEPTAP
jgi:phospholipid/cholesterol/gamma-HCH transport system substrate-binding protein